MGGKGRGNSYILSAAALLVITISALFVNQAAASTSIDEWFQKVRLTNEKVAKIEFYTDPSGAQTVPVASAGNLTVPPANFGLVAVVDFRLTAGPNLTSSDLVGRDQGFFTSSSMSDFSFFTALNILFQTGQYKGSTLTIVGYDPTAPDSRELNVIGGTGEFRLARGFVNFSSYSRNPTNNLTNVLRFSVTVLHYGSTPFHSD